MSRHRGARALRGLTRRAAATARPGRSLSAATRTLTAPLPLPLAAVLPAPERARFHGTRWASKRHQRGCQHIEATQSPCGRSFMQTGSGGCSFEYSDYRAELFEPMGDSPEIRDGRRCAQGKDQKSPVDPKRNLNEHPHLVLFQKCRHPDQWSCKGGQGLR